MKKDKVVSKFKQTRSTNTRNHILKYAEEFFCEHGYYGSSVKDIAKYADISIGSIYFYFKDKDELLLEIYKIQNERFITTIKEALDKKNEYENDKHQWLKEFVQLLFKTYGLAGKLRSELSVLSYNNPEIGKQRKDIKDKAIKVMRDYINQSVILNDLKVGDFNIAHIMVIDLIDATYDRLIREGNKDDYDKTIEECVTLLYKYLFT